MVVGLRLTWEPTREGGPATKEAVARWASGTPSAVAETSLLPAAVDLSVTTAPPPLPVVAVEEDRVLPTPITEKVTGRPASGVPEASRTNAVSVTGAIPSAVAVPGLAESVERTGSTGAGGAAGELEPPHAWSELASRHVATRRAVERIGIPFLPFDPP